ncbi:disks large homolog 5-like [Mesocricetus auratus]|uniref:Disks large homolog 5-like n=1 Tax=Mesocricetus auratus TaxID=10036 RepID=A0ABM2Y596_MESAU|nr:disks large homolog 5-like [Mesocricetus auratus]
MLTRVIRLLWRRNGEQRKTRGRQEEETSGKASSTPSFLTEKEQQLNKMEKLTLQLKMMTYERDELSVILAHYTSNDCNNRPNSDLEMLKMEHQKEMSDLKKYPKEISEALYKCMVLTEKTNSYCTLHSQLLSEWAQLKEKVYMLKEDNRKLKGEQILLQESCEEAKKLCEETHEKIYGLWTMQQQEHQRLEENLQSLLKQKELITQQKDLAVKLQHHFTESQMRFEHLQKELEQNTAQEESLLQTELLKQEHYVPAPLKRTEKTRGSQRHLEGMTFYTLGSRPPQKRPPPCSCEATSEPNINLPSEDPTPI